MRHVRDELPLDFGQLLQLPELALQAGRHLVERGRQRGEIVHAEHPHAFLEMPGRQPLGRLGRVPDGQHHPPGDQRRDRGQQHGEHEPGTDQDPLDQQQERLLRGKRVHVVQLVIRPERDTDGQRGAQRLPVVADERGRLVLRNGHVLVVVLLVLLFLGHPGEQAGWSGWDGRRGAEAVLGHPGHAVGLRVRLRIGQVHGD